MQYKNLKKEVDVDCLMLKSISTYGVINPVIARYKNHKYEIILDRRRF